MAEICSQAKLEPSRRSATPMEHKQFSQGSTGFSVTWYLLCLRGYRGDTLAEPNVGTPISRTGIGKGGTSPLKYS